MRELHTPYGGYASVSVQALLQHLFACYAKIGPAELEANDARLAAPWDPNEPFEALVQRFQTCVAYAKRGGEEVTPERQLRIGYRLISATGLFPDDCRRWREGVAPGTTSKTWVHFVTHFRKAHRAWLDAAREAPANYSAAALGPAPAPARAPYSPATLDPGLAPPLPDDELPSDAVSAIASLAVATQADRSAISTLTATVASLQADLRSRDEIIASLRSELRQARRRRGRGRASTDDTAAPRAPDNAATPRPAEPPPAPRVPRRHDHRHYCSTHGYWTDHPSHECPDPGPNHNPDATRRNRMGGSEANRKRPPG